jgi:hypothetical protein
MAREGEGCGAGAALAHRDFGQNEIEAQRDEKREEMRFEPAAAPAGIGAHAREQQGRDQVPARALLAGQAQ